jgi:ribosomal protein S12 methylthiotransferase
MKVKSLRKDKVNVITLGCSKNLVDSENIITQLKANDYDVVHEAHDDNANIIVVNTCGFIDLAKQESVDTILHYAREKTEGRIEKLYVTGCLSHRYKDDLEAEIPEVDAFFGTMELPALLGKFNADYKHELIGERITTTPTHFAYLKISEGCNRTCSFCAIPLMRGGHVSKSIEALVKEATSLARMGVKELILIAQELTYYGLDIYKERKLGPLLEALSEVEGIEWIRLHYAYPSKFPREVFDYMAKLPKVCKYLDIPLQHASNSVLARMKRQTTMEEQRDLIQYARQVVPNISIRTTFLVGFPGESVKEFNDLCKFVKEMQFERVGVFQYSHEEGTSAYLVEDNVTPKTKKARAEKLMEIQRDISYEKNMSKVGQEFKILVDKKEGGYFIGRTEYDSPEVDNEVLIDASKFFVRTGDFAKVKIVNAEEYDLIAEVI